MTRNIYEPLKLNQTNRYAGYQFHARVRLDGMEPDAAFRYLILSVYHWIRSRVPEEDRKVPELALPEPEEAASVSDQAFLPYHFSVGYTMDITPLVEDGIWSLRLKEPDIGTDERPSVSGRFFTTRVGLRLQEEKGYTELGIRIDITDPASAEKEVPFAFRPGFVRSLAIQPAVTFEQVREMRYGQPDRISTEEDYKRLLYMLDNEDNQLPLAVFTHYRHEEKKTLSMSMEEFLKSEAVKSFLPSSGLGFGMPGKKDIPMPDRSSVSGMPALRPGVVVSAEKKLRAEAVPAAGPSDPARDAAAPVLLYDTDAFARSAFGYARTAVLDDSFFDRFSSRVKKDILPGDIVLCGARKFRGTVTAISCPGEKEEDLKKAYNAALLAAQSYSKHKAPYAYGTVLFEAEARRLEQQREIQRILESGTMEEKEKYDRLVAHVEKLNEVIRGKEEKIARLEAQCAEEYERGVEYMSGAYDTLEEENARLRRELSDQQDRIGGMEGTYRQAKDALDALAQIRRVNALPVNNEDVVKYFRMVYRDRLDFTERGEAEASRCGLRPANLWDVLYTVANDLVDVFRNAQGNLTEEEVMQATGFTLSFHEGSMTREQKDFMRLREDVYDGKTISVEPHLKLKTSKGEPAHQRLHFCYVPELRRIVIGYVGDHLDSAATRYAGQR